MKSALADNLLREATIDQSSATSASYDLKVLSQDSPYSAWMGVITTLGEWWDAGEDSVAMYGLGVLGTSDKIYRSTGEVAIQHNGSWYLAKASAAKDRSGFRVRFDVPYKKSEVQVVPWDHPCLALRVTNINISKPDILLRN